MGACFGAYPPGYNFVPGGWEGNDKKPTLRACAAAQKKREKYRMHKASAVPEFRPVAAPSFRGVIQEEVKWFGLSAIYTISLREYEIL